MGAVKDRKIQNAKLFIHYSYLSSKCFVGFPFCNRLRTRRIVIIIQIKAQPPPTERPIIILLLLGFFVVFSTKE